MGEAFFIFFIPMGGWVTDAGVYSSDSTQAKAFFREEAMTYCRARNRDGGFKALPVSETDLLETKLP